MIAIPTVPSLTVACLCAGWCTACQAYAAVFAEVARQHPTHRFVWVDIETHSDALGDGALDIENFPTLLLLAGEQPLFHGTVLPHASTLERMLEAAAQQALAPGQPCPDGLAPATAALCRQLPAVA